MADLKKMAEEIVGLTLLEAAELKNILKDEYGIEPAAGGAVMVAAAGCDEGAAAENHLSGKGRHHHRPTPKGCIDAAHGGYGLHGCDGLRRQLAQAFASQSATRDSLVTTNQTCPPSQRIPCRRPWLQ